ncbi:MAG: LPS assembly lipoprotein LptE [Pseudomonadota bacterium]
MQRRLWLAMMASGATLGLSACGFKLRRAPDFAFKSLFSPLAENSQLGVELKRSLESSGKVRVITDARLINEADAVLEVIYEQREKTVVGLNSSGQVREFQLRIRFKFRLRTMQGRELIPETEIVQQRDISFNESAVLAKEAEEALLYRDMQSDIVQQIMRRLAAVQTLAPPPV